MSLLYVKVSGTSRSDYSLIAGNSSGQRFKDDDSGFFIQRFVIIAALGRLNATGAAVLAGALGDRPVGRLPKVMN